MFLQAIDANAALKAIQDFLESYGAIDSEITEICHNQLLFIWHIEDVRIRDQIIETAAINLNFYE